MGWWWWGRARLKLVTWVSQGSLLCIDALGLQLCLWGNTDHPEALHLVFLMSPDPYKSFSHKVWISIWSQRIGLWHLLELQRHVFLIFKIEQWTLEGDCEGAEEDVQRRLPPAAGKVCPARGGWGGGRQEGSFTSMLTGPSMLGYVLLIWIKVPMSWRNLYVKGLPVFPACSGCAVSVGFFLLKLLSIMQFGRMSLRI